MNHLGTRRTSGVEPKTRSRPSCRIRPLSATHGSSIAHTWLDSPWRDFGLVQLAVVAVIRLHEMELDEDAPPKTLEAARKPLEEAEKILSAAAR